MNALCRRPLFILFSVVAFGQSQGCSNPEGKTSVRTSTIEKANEVAIDLGPSKIILVHIPAGTFWMGSEKGAQNERPVHQVTIRHNFWMGKFTITQAQYEAVTGKNPSRWKKPDNPVNNVSWNDANLYLQKLNLMNRAFEFRLPTESEWEYACRAGTKGETYGPLNKIAWYGNPLFGKVHPVGLKEPNAFGLYDMLGNVSEYCQDWYKPYSKEAQVDPKGSPPVLDPIGFPIPGEGPLIRGGSFLHFASDCRAARRFLVPPGYRHFSCGFRVVATPISGPE